METTKFLLIADNGDGENKTVAYCKSEKEVKDLIKEWMEDGQNPEEMEVVRVRKISRVKTKIIKSTIIF